MEHIAQGKRSDTLGFPHSRVSAPCKGKSFNPLCYYSYLIADLAVLKWNIVCIFCSIPAPCLKAFALSGRDCSNTRYPGCRFACPGLCAPLGFQPALAKSETWVKTSKLVLYCSRFALSLHKIGGGSAMKIKNAFFLFIALALHYLCTLKMSCPNKDNPECLVNLVKNKIYDK